MDIKENTYTKRSIYEPPCTCEQCTGCIAGVIISSIFVAILLLTGSIALRENHEDITIAFMNLTISETTETSFNAGWDLSIRVPPSLPGHYMCLQGEFQASLLYNNIPIATTPIKSYNNLHPRWSQILKVSGDVTKEDVSGAIAKSIMNDIKEKREVLFTLRLSLPDCRPKTIGMMKYVCDEAELRYESSPLSSKIIATVVGHPSCHYVGH